MASNTQAKFIELLNWYQSYAKKKYPLNGPSDASQIKKIEKMIGEKFPDELNEIYSVNDGETNTEAFFGETFMPMDEIRKALIFSVNNAKKEAKKPDNPEKKAELLGKIIPLIMALPKKKPWFKLKMETGSNSFGGPYLYTSEDAVTNDKYSIIEMDFDDYEPIKPLVIELLELENLSYDTGEINFEVFKDGHYKLSNKNIDLGEDLTCYPKDTIKKIYFHYKWLPFITDEGGNYIGLDLDPDKNGTKRQVINFGRDEDEMVVLGKSLDEFLDMCLAETKKKDSGEFKNLGKWHLHYILSLIAKNK